MKLTGGLKTNRFFCYRRQSLSVALIKIKMHVYILLKITTKLVGLSKCFILIFGVKDLNKEVIPFPPWEPTIRVDCVPHSLVWWLASLQELEIPHLDLLLFARQHGVQ